ncbi:hypothetical protein BJX99DRAFT_259713 [Aspergillus californicus]
MASRPARKYVSKLVPSSDILLFACIVGTSFADSVLTGFDSSLMGSLNVMPTYKSYFLLNTATTALNTASSYIGGCIGALFAGYLADRYGRRSAIWTSTAISIIGAILQTAAVHIAMFIVGRIVIGVGMAVAATATPTFVAEVARPSYRAFALGVYYACWGVGTLLATAVCYGTEHWASNWAWRFPSLMQVIPGLAAGIIVCFVPESPRWLVSQDRDEEALEVLAIVNSQGNKNDPAVLSQFQEISLSIRHSAGTEGAHQGRQLGLLEAWTSKTHRKRLAIVTTFSVIVMLSGDSIITFYFGSMLSQAGITDPTTQLEVNIVLTSWNLAVAVLASWYVDCLPRKVLAALSLGLLAIFQFLLGGLTARYGGSSNTSGVYGTIASIFLCTAVYRIGLTPLTMLYPAEVLPYAIRATGMGVYTLTTKLAGLVNALVFPFALDGIGWKTYMVVGGYDVVMVVGILVFYVETRGESLDGVALLDGLDEKEMGQGGLDGHDRGDKIDGSGKLVEIIHPTSYGAQDEPSTTGPLSSASDSPVSSGPPTSAQVNPSLSCESDQIRPYPTLHTTSDLEQPLDTGKPLRGGARNISRQTPPHFRSAQLPSSSAPATLPPSPLLILSRHLRSQAYDCHEGPGHLPSGPGAKLALNQSHNTALQSLRIMVFNIGIGTDL